MPPAQPSISSPFLAHDDSGIGVFESNVGTQTDAWLADRFAEASWQSDNTLRSLNGKSSRTLDEFKKSSDYSTAKQMLNMLGRWKAGDKSHTWVFDAAGPQGGMPRRALELEDLSGPGGYHVRATVHCYDEPDTCALYAKKQTELLAPKPQEAAGDLSLRQWRNRVFVEECTELPANMDQPRYPVHALLEGRSGTVFIGILFNRCGNVRDSWLLQSSNHRNLDRAALSKSLEWQLDLKTLPPGAMEKRIAKIPIRFEVGDSVPPGQSN
jgi:TonB family protein